MTQYTFGRVLHPPFDDLYVEKPKHTGSGYGYDYVAGGRKIYGAVQHETGGASDTPRGIAKLFGPGGERYGDALTDYVTGKDGKIGRLNDPLGTRAGWASGGGVGLPGGLEGDGPAFYAIFGAWGINTNLVSNENCKGWTENLTEKQVEFSGWLEAYWQDQAKCKFDTYPVNDRWGIVMSFLHYEFGTTSCGKDMLDDISRVQNHARAILTAAQTGKELQPYVKPLEPTPDPSEPKMPNGDPVSVVATRFGSLVRDGHKHGFDPKGPISLTWYNRCVKENVWPEGETWTVVPHGQDGIHFCVFSNGWVLIKASSRAGWRWL